MSFWLIVLSVVAFVVALVLVLADAGNHKTVEVFTLAGLGLFAAGHVAGPPGRA